MTSVSGETPKTNPNAVHVVIASGDFISGVTSWAFRLRDAFKDHSYIRIHVLNCLNTTSEVGQFDAITPTTEAFIAYLHKFPNPIVIPNYFWDLMDVCIDHKRSGPPLRIIGYCRSDSEEEYYLPLSKRAASLDHIIAVSPECKASLETYLSTSCHPNISVLPTGIWVPKQLERTWQTDPIRLAYGGRIESNQKRSQDIIPFIKELYRAEIPFVLSIAGAGRFIETLRTQIDEADPENRVTILGRILPQNMPAFWKQHDVMLSFSEYEGTSNSMLEAMAQGCLPVVSNTRSGQKGIIENGVTGVVVPDNDLRKMVRSIGELADSLVNCCIMGTAAHHACSPFTMQQHASVFSNIVTRILFEQETHE